MVSLSEQSAFIKSNNELYDDFTTKLMEDYYLILKDGRIVGFRLPTDTDVSLPIRFEVMGMRCTSAGDVGWSRPFSPRGLGYDLYLNATELSTIISLVPNQNHLITALPIFMDDTEKPLHDEIIAFRPTEKIDEVDKHLLFIYAPYLIQLFLESGVNANKPKSFRLRNYKHERCRILKEEYDYPPDMESGGYSYGIGGWMNFFEVADPDPLQRGVFPLGLWKTLLMCEICGKFYLSMYPSSFEYRTGVGCPVCLESYPEEGEKSVVTSDGGPWFRLFIPEYPLEEKFDFKGYEDSWYNNNY